MLISEVSSFIVCVCVCGGGGGGGGECGYTDHAVSFGNLFLPKL